MSIRDHHEAVWRALPRDLEPEDESLRAQFLLANVRPGQCVLDVGCGDGRFAAVLAAAGAAVVAADVAEEPLRRARARLPEGGGPVELLLLPGEGPWPLADASFDVVWAGEVIEHVADTAAWLSEARRVLRSGGKLLVTTPAHGPLTRLRLALDGRAFAARLHPLSDHLRFYSDRSLAELLEGFGFEQVRVRSAGGLPGARRRLLASAVRSRF